MERVLHTIKLLAKLAVARVSCQRFLLMLSPLERPRAKGGNISMSFKSGLGFTSEILKELTFQPRWLQRWRGSWR